MSVPEQGAPSASPRPRVVVFAYACDPDTGSESGAGWGLVRSVARFADVVVLVGPEHTPALMRWAEAHPTEPLKFVVVPEAPWAKWSKSSRIPKFFVYLAWLGKAEAVARRLHRDRPFDVAHHATYSTYWLPSPATRLGIPSVVGPIGGAVTTPPSLWKTLGPLGLVEEWFDWLAVRVAARWPATQATLVDATICVVQNEATLRCLPQSARAKARVLNHVHFIEAETTQAESFGEILFVAPLETRKGPLLAIRALAATGPEVRLTVVGDGPERERMERLAVALGVERRMTFLGKIPRAEVLRLVSGARAALFVGLREEGGLALAEAMFLGTPLILLDNGGPSNIAARATDPSRVELVPAGSVIKTAQALGQAMARAVQRTVTDRSPLLDRAAANEELRAIFYRAVSEKMQ